MIFKNVVFVLISILLSSLKPGYGCDGIKNVFMTIKDITGRKSTGRKGPPAHGAWSNTTLSECIQRSAFEGKKITEIHVKDQNIPRLGKDYVKHLIHLDILEFKNCKIEKIVPGAFKNLGALRIVGITHNPTLRVIEGGIFDIFDSIHFLRLNNNNIDTITDEALSNMTLQEVNFSYNDFSKFDPVWFAHSPYIKNLYFQNNHIKNLPAKAFDTMTKLEDINFENNEISKIGREAFGKIKKLRKLNLRNNRLKVISSNIFRNSNFQIDFLNVAGNFLNTISDDIIEKLVLKEISIEYNPFACTCYSDLVQYFTTNGIVVKKSDNCNLNSVPYCLSTGTACEFLSNQENIQNLTKRYFQVFQNLPYASRKCTGLVHYSIDTETD